MLTLDSRPTSSSLSVGLVVVPEDEGMHSAIRVPVNVTFIVKSCVSVCQLCFMDTIGGTCISICLGNGEEGERELRSCGVETRCEDSIRPGCQQHPGGGGPGGSNDHVPHGKPQKLSNISSYI